MKGTKKEKIKNLLARKKRIKELLNHIDEIFLEEKENEDAWPGHDTIGYCHANIEGQVFEKILARITTQLKELGVKENE